MNSASYIYVRELLQLKNSIIYFQKSLRSQETSIGNHSPSQPHLITGLGPTNSNPGKHSIVQENSGLRLLEEQYSPPLLFGISGNGKHFTKNIIK